MMSSPQSSDPDDRNEDVKTKKRQNYGADNRMRDAVKYWFLATLLFLPASAAAFSPASTKLALPAWQRTIVHLTNEPRHDVRSNGPSTEIDPEEIKVQAALAEHQQRAPKLGFDVDVRSLVQYNHGFAVMSTNSKANPGFPGGSVVGFAPDEMGRPVFIFSGMSSHTQDILADPRCSVTIASKEFKGAADGRVNLMGKVKLVNPEERDAVKAVYLAKHPGAFWVDFGDFNWFRMDEITDIRFVGGFARAGSITPEQYFASQPDPVAAFGPAIANHMNEDHMDSTIAMIAHAIPGLDVSEAVITSVDSLGMYVKCTRTPRASDQPQQFKIRLPFPRKAEGRKDVKDLIVEMTRAAQPS